MFPNNVEKINKNICHHLNVLYLLILYTYVGKCNESK